MAYYFQKIDTVLSPEQREEEDETILYNLDEFHMIRQFGTEVRAKRGGEKSTLLARCKTSKGAQRVIQGILEQKVVTIDDVLAAEEDTPGYF